MQTEHGLFHMHLESQLDDKEHVALSFGLVSPETGQLPESQEEDVFVRVHSECLTGDVFGSQRCDCGQQLDKAMSIIASQGRGRRLLRRAGIGLANKLKAYHLQDRGMDTVEANEARPPVTLGVRDRRADPPAPRSPPMRLLNNPKKIHGLSGYGIELIDQVPLEIEPNPNNIGYRTKKDRMGHTLEAAFGAEGPILRPRRIAGIGRVAGRPKGRRWRS